MINALLTTVLFLDLNFIAINHCFNDQNLFRRFEQRMFFEKNLKLLQSDMELAFVMSVFNDKHAKIHFIKIKDGDLQNMVFDYVDGDKIFHVEIDGENLKINEKEFFICCYEDCCVKLNKILSTHWDVFAPWQR